MRRITFHFEVGLPDAGETQEHIDSEAKRLKRHLRELLMNDVEFSVVETGNLAAVIRPTEAAREFGAVDRWVIDDV